MSKRVAAGLMCLGIVTVGLAVSRGQEGRSPPPPRTDAQAVNAAVEQAKTVVQLAEQNIGVQKLQNECDIGAAEAKCSLALLDVHTYREGDLAYEKKLLESEAGLAAEEDELVRHAASKESTGKDDGEIARLRAKARRTLAQGKLDLLVNFHAKRRTTELESRVVQYNRELELAKLKAAVALTRATAELAAARRTLDLVSEAAGPRAEPPIAK